ncbi:MULTISPECIES: hypothetical protein [Sphingomonas]|uniref:hypothetical protein n=1 Tax=Sphingomonas TaxID=13687 RepID=UPI0012E33CD5|nr:MULTISPECIES: hypothetical protein [Sphingomonas]MBY0303014.1 hypothetical protein [Sphingomonas ginsenosidimutans]
MTAQLGSGLQPADSSKRGRRALPVRTRPDRLPCRQSKGGFAAPRPTHNAVRLEQPSSEAETACREVARRRTFSTDGFSTVLEPCSKRTVVGRCSA